VSNAYINITNTNDSTIAHSLIGYDGNGFSASSIQLDNLYLTDVIIIGNSNTSITSSIGIQRASISNVAVINNYYPEIDITLSDGGQNSVMTAVGLFNTFSCSLNIVNSGRLINSVLIASHSSSITASTILYGKSMLSSHACDDTTNYEYVSLIACDAKVPIKDYTLHTDNLAILETPSNDDALTQLLVRATTGEIKYRDVSSITGGGGGDMNNPMTAVGDIILGGSSGTPTRLGIGSNGQVLSSNGTTALWSTPTAIPAGTAQGDILYWNGSSWAKQSIGTAGQVVTANGTATGIEYTTVAALPSGTTGQTLVYDGSWAAYPTGTAGMVYTSNGASTVPTWQNIAGTVQEIIVGSGLTGTSPLTSTGTITLGTPSTITSSSSNSISASSHTHALNNTGVTAGTYNNSSITVDAAGRITSASEGTSTVTAKTVIVKGNGTVGVDCTHLTLESALTYCASNTEYKHIYIESNGGTYSPLGSTFAIDIPHLTIECAPEVLFVPSSSNQYIFTLTTGNTYKTIMKGVSFGSNGYAGCIGFMFLGTSRFVDIENMLYTGDNYLYIVCFSGTANVFNVNIYNSVISKTNSSISCDTVVYFNSSAYVSSCNINDTFVYGDISTFVQVSSGSTVISLKIANNTVTDVNRSAAAVYFFPTSGSLTLTDNWFQTGNLLNYNDATTIGIMTSGNTVRKLASRETYDPLINSNAYITKGNILAYNT